MQLLKSLLSLLQWSADKTNFFKCFEPICFTAFAEQFCVCIHAGFLSSNTQFTTLPQPFVLVCIEAQHQPEVTDQGFLESFLGICINLPMYRDLLDSKRYVNAFKIPWISPIPIIPFKFFDQPLVNPNWCSHLRHLQC